MKTFKSWSSPHGHVMFLVFLMMIHKGSACEPPSRPLCFRRHSKETVYICEWSMAGNESNVAFDLLCNFSGRLAKNIKTTRLELNEEELMINRTVEMWVAAHVGNSTCTSPRQSAVLVQTVKFDSPESTTVSWMKKNLTLRWKAAETLPALAEICFRQNDHPTQSWNTTKVKASRNGSMYQAVLVDLLRYTSYEVQIRHQSTQAHNPLWSNWSRLIVPAELEHEPEITWTIQPSNGTRKVMLSWKSMSPAASARGTTVFLKNSQSSNVCPCREKRHNTTSTEYSVLVLDSAANISVYAENAVGKSPVAVIQIPAVPATDLEICNKILLDKKIKKKTCLEWYELQEADSEPTNGIILSGWKTNEEKEKIRSTIQDNIRYLYFEHKCLNGMPQTTQTCLYYKKESAPDKEPKDFNAVSETMTSVNLSWTEIPLKNQRGFLTHYSLCKVESSSQNETKECFNISSSVVKHCLENLMSGTRYNISLSGVTRVGKGPEATIFVNTKPEKSVIVWLSFCLLFVFFLFSIMCTFVSKRIQDKLFPPVPRPVIPDFPLHQQETQPITQTLLQVSPEEKTVCEEAEEVTVLGGEWDDEVNEGTEVESRNESGGSDDECSSPGISNAETTTREGEMTDLEQRDNELASLIYRNGLVFDVKTDSS